MDEIQHKKIILKNLIKFSIMVLILTFIITLPFIIFSRMDYLLKIYAFIFSFFAVPIILFLIIYQLQYKRFRKNSIIFSSDYNRTIPKDCTPAIASLLYEFKIDVYKDYTATILELCNKKFINFIGNSTNYEFQILKSDDETVYLQEHEKYVFNCISQKIEFNSKKFKKLIIHDAIHYDFIKYNNTSRLSSILNILYLFAFIFLVSSSSFLFFITFIFISWMTFIIKSKEFTRTEKGVELAKQISELKNFIRDYTLINEKNIDHVKLLGEYISYAISLDEAKQIENFVKNNENYRALIYNFKLK